MNKIERKTIYCFTVTLKQLNEDSYFYVPFKVLAKDKFEAQTILEEWLSVPSQTGFKYDRWGGISPEASESLLLKI